MRIVRAALALLLAFAIPVRAETTTDPLWFLFSTYVLAPDAQAVQAEGEGLANAKRLAALQADLLLLSEGFESFRDEAQVRESLARLESRMTPELRPYFRDRATSLDAIYRTLAVTDYTWAQRFPEPPCLPAEARRKLLDNRDGLFQTQSGEASVWLSSLLGAQAKGKSAEQALDQASSKSRLTAADYEKRRAHVRKLTLALASDKAVGAARSKLYCSRAAAFEDLAAYHHAAEASATLASRPLPVTVPEKSVFVVVLNSRRAAATLLKTKNGPVLVTDASIVQDGDHPQVFAYSEKSNPVELTATVIHRDAAFGLAILTYAEDLTRPALVLAASAPVHHDLVSALGHTLVAGLWTKTTGLVTKTGPESFQTDAAVSVDFTGGPVLNGAGEVVGVLVSRPADTEEGRWPVAIPASAISRWLDGVPTTVVPASESITDDGTAALISRARPVDVAGQALTGLVVASLPVAPQGNIVCMKYCEGSSSPTRSYSSYSGGSSYDQGSAELGQAIGKLGAVLILKGIPALFRGIGRLFENKSPSPAKIADNRQRVAHAEMKEPKEPQPPLKPKCELKQAAIPTHAGAEPFDIVVQFVCDDEKIAKAGQPVTFTFEWGGMKPMQTATVTTDASGNAKVTVRVSNENVAVHRVRLTADRSLSDLDRYDPERKTPEAPIESEPEEMVTAPALAGREVAPVGMADSKAVNKTAEAAVVVPSAVVSAAQAGRVITLVGEGAVLRVSAVIVLGPAETAAIVLVTGKLVFDIGWSIGTRAEEKIEEMQRAQKAYDKSIGELAKASNMDDDLEIPGDCTKIRWKELDVQVGRKCKSLPRSCLDVAKADCVELRERLLRNNECVAARRQLMNECFRGGDPIHKRLLNGENEVLKLCEERLKDECHE